MQKVMIRVLGTAQDAGLPQMGCRCPRCDRARREPAFARKAVSLALQNLTTGRQFLIDATPDMREQLDWLMLHGSVDRVGRPPVDGVLLTHAHIGHYAGLIHFGREAMGARGLPVWCTPAIAEFLRSHAPWSQLVHLNNIELRPEFVPGRPLRIDDGITVTPLLVPHRNEFADTICFRIHGPTRSVLYCTDIDRWDQWDRNLREEVASVDVAILDGCFFSGEELRARGRDPREVPHPPMMETMERLHDLVAEGKKVYFTHMNHSNPTLDPVSPERQALEAAGFRLLEEGALLPL